MKRAIVLALLAACGGEGSTMEVPPTGVPEILELSVTSPLVAPYESVDLRWRVSRAWTVTIGVAGGSTLVSTYDGSGTVTTEPLGERTTFVLTAASADATATSSVTVDVAWTTPVIDLEVAGGAFLGAPLFVRWSAADAERVRLLQDGVEVLNVRVQRHAASELPVLLTQTRTVLRFEASNPAHTAVEERVVIAGMGTDVEPNNFFSQAEDITGYQLVPASLSSTMDVDVFMFRPRGTTVQISTTGQSGHGCDVDTRLRVLSDVSTVVAEAQDGGEPTGRGGACAALLIGDARSQLPAVLYVEVYAEAGESGFYLLSVEER